MPLLTSPLHCVQGRVIDDWDVSRLKRFAQVAIKPLAINMPQVAVLVVDAVRGQQWPTPRGALLVAGNVASGAEVFPQPQRPQWLPNCAGKRFAAPGFFRGRPVKNDRRSAQIRKPDCCGGPGGSRAKDANVGPLFHLPVSEPLARISRSGVLTPLFGALFKLLRSNHRIALLRLLSGCEAGTGIVSKFPANVSSFSDSQKTGNALQTLFPLC